MDDNKEMVNLIHHFTPGTSMSLFISSVDRYGVERDFYCHCSSMELTLDIVSAISLLGDVFLRVELVENDQCMQLPVEVFDGVSFSLPLRQLEREWQQVLGEPGHPIVVKSAGTDS